MQRNQNPPVKFVAPSGPGALTQREINDIHRAGYLAAWRDHLTIEACPYRRNPETGSGYDPDRARAWITGFSAAQTDLRLFRDGATDRAPDAKPY